jgi:hypothetical protein
MVLLFNYLQSACTVRPVPVSSRALLGSMRNPLWKGELSPSLLPPFPSLLAYLTTDRFCNGLFTLYVNRDIHYPSPPNHEHQRGQRLEYSNKGMLPVNTESLYTKYLLLPSLFEPQPYFAPTRHSPLFPSVSTARFYDFSGTTTALSDPPLLPISGRPTQHFCLPAENSSLRYRVHEYLTCGSQVSHGSSHEYFSSFAIFS